MTNVFACLVHDQPDTVADLVANLSYLDPGSRILLYNGGRDDTLLRRRFDTAGDATEPLVHPAPSPQRWGRLHGFAVDCMRFALAKLRFETLTIVDSDQLLLRPGYSQRIERFLDEHPAAGMLGQAPGVHSRDSRHPAVLSAWRERRLWMPFCRRYPGGEAAFVHWTFWPTTVFTATACRDVVRTFDDDDHLPRVMASSRIFATEEVVLPTIVALHGHEVVRNPCCHDYVKYHVRFTPQTVGVALDQPDAFWIHPAPRPYEHHLRGTIRQRHHGYRRAPTEGVVMPEPPTAPLLRTLPILERMRTIRGWLSDDEADLLIAGAARSLTELAGDTAVVEVGSYCGRSTMVLGSVMRSLRPNGRVHAIDPHAGEVGAADRGFAQTGPTLEEFRRNISAAGLGGFVETIQQYTWEVEWDRPIGFVLIDGLHDYMNVRRDFSHFERWLVDGGYAAFHDYADYWPGVKAFVDELLAGGGYERVDCAASMILLRRRAGQGESAPARLTVAEPEPEPVRLPDPNPARPGQPAPGRIAATASAAGLPLVSCVMPTYGRAELVPRAVASFLRQDHPHAELIVVDDGPEPLADLIPDDPRVRHLRLESRLTIGAKRNLGCEAARGDLLANWDDDDWYAVGRLRRQVTAIAGGADVVGVNRLLYLEPATCRAWRYAWPPHGRPWVHDAVLLFTRDLWRRNPFPDTSRGIDCRFLWTPTRKRIVAMPDEDLYVGIIHGDNTSPKDTRHGLWSPHPPELLAALMGEEAAAYGCSIASAAR
ncbi:MAG TPA: glycosyltransferase [Solirubrobacteraceae bacterium]|jgi:hypothetical protein|nr:glycosyltransferase [Solirubrobacteraceae bacterium]